MFSLSKVYKGFEVIERYLDTLAGILLVAMMILIMADVSLRELFNSPLQGTLELTELSMVGIVFAALSYSQFCKAHLHIDILTGMYGPKIKLIVEIISMLICFIFFALLVWQGGKNALFSWQIREETMNSAAPFPVYFSKSMVPIGSFVICIRFAIDICEHLKALLKKER